MRTSGTPLHIAAGPIQLLVLQPTQFCNINCDYCYLPDRGVFRTMHCDTLKGVIFRVLNSDLVSPDLTVLWHLGEPLTLPVSYYYEAFATIALINQERENGPISIRHSIQTNGTLITQLWCDLFTEWDVGVSVSLDGPEHIHNAHRKRRNGTGVFADTMRGIELLQKNGRAVSIIAVLTADSLDDPDSLFDFFIRHGIEYIGFNVEEITGVNEQSSIIRRGAEHKYSQFMGRFYDLTVQSGGRIKVREFESLLRRITSRPPYVFNSLVAPLSIVSVDIEGNFTTFCPELLPAKTQNYPHGFKIGNIITDDLKSCINTDLFKRIKEEVAAGVGVCEARCDYFDLCKGGAPSNKLFEHGSFNVAETGHCLFTRKLLIDVLLTKLEATLDRV